MAKVIHMPDGTSKIFFEDNETSLRELIEEKLGRDAVEIYDSVVEERNEYRSKVEYGYGQDEDDDDEDDVALLTAHKGMVTRM